MNILLINYSYYNSGGDWTHTKLLEDYYKIRGHKVINFALKHRNNYHSDYSKYFPKELDFRNVANESNIKSKLRHGINTLYNFEAKRNIKKLLNENDVDIVHLQNFLVHISPSIISEIKKREIPIIYTLHDYQLLCPVATFLSNDKICEDCKFHKYYMTIVKKCKRNSYPYSFFAAIRAYFLTFLNIKDKIDLFISPSKFLLEKHLEYGVKRDKIIHLNYFLESNVFYENFTKGNYGLWMGRLSDEKGINVLLKYLQKTDHSTFVIGDGKFKNKLLEVAKENCNVNYVGKKENSEIMMYLDASKYLIVTSIWYENLPFVILEALARSKPVIVPNIAEMRNLVGVNNQRGFFYELGDHDDLNDKIYKMESLDNNSYFKLCKNAYDFAKKNFTDKKYFQILNQALKRVDIENDL